MIRFISSRKWRVDPPPLVVAAPSAANADSITVGWWDQAQAKSGIHTVALNHHSVHSRSKTKSSGHLSLASCQQRTMATTLMNLRSITFFSVGNVADTGRIYTTFTDITFTGNNPVSFPATLFQRSENTLPGWTLAEQVFICPNGDLFCDNYINPTGIMLASFTFTNGALGTHFVDSECDCPRQSIFNHGGLPHRQRRR
jgi:hypothetical protein